MAFSSKTFTVEEVQSAIKEHGAENVFVFEPRVPKEGKTWRQGVGYMSTKMRLKPTDVPENASIYAQNMYVARAALNPADAKQRPNDKKEDRETNDVTIGISFNHSTDYGNLIKTFETQRSASIKQLEAAGKLVSWSNKNVCAMVAEKYGDQAPKDKIGKPYPDPLDAGKNDQRLTLTLDFSPYPAESYIPKGLQGKPRCVVKDFTTGRVNPETGQIEYDLLLVDGAPVGVANAHEVFTSGTILEEVYISINSTSKSMFGISTRQNVQEVVVTVKKRPSNSAVAVVGNANLAERLAKMKAAQGKAAAVTSAPSSAPEEIEGTGEVEETAEVAESEVADADGSVAAALDGI